MMEITSSQIDINMKKKDTFATRAKKIMAKYPRHTYDELERKDMLKELESLKEEQEMMREVMGIAEGADKMDEMAKGGYMKYDGTERTQYVTKNTTPIPEWLTNATNPAAITPKASSIYPTSNGNQYGEMLGSNNISGVQSLQTSAAPYFVAAGASAIGDIASLINMRKTRPDNISLPRVTPTKIDLQSEREAAGRTYNTNRNIMLRNSRDMSSPSNAYANQVAGLSSLQDSYGTMMSQSYMNEANTNAQFANHASMQNSQLGAREADINFQAQKEKSDAQTGMIGNMANTIPSALRDYRSDYSQNMMMSIMGKDYGLYGSIPPPMNSWQQFLYNLRGPQYQVLNRQYANQIKG